MAFLSDRNILNPSTTPYYDEQFFVKSREVKEEGLLNVTKISSTTWYKVLLENNVTHRVDANGVTELIPSQAELAHPERNWEAICSLAATPGFPSELSSFLWLMFHNILPTK